MEQLEKVNKRAARFITENYEFKSGNTGKKYGGIGISSISTSSRLNTPSSIYLLTPSNLPIVKLGGIL